MTRNISPGYRIVQQLVCTRLNKKKRNYRNNWTLKFVRMYARMLLLENRNLGDSGPQVPVPLLDPSSPSLPIERPYCENWDCRRSRGVLNNLSWYLTQAVHQRKANYVYGKVIQQNTWKSLRRPANAVKQNVPSLKQTKTSWLHICTE